MAEYREREALLQDIEESVCFTVRPGYPSAEIRGANKITDRIKSAPTADVVEVRHGEWEHFAKIEVKQTGGKIPMPTKYLHAQCSNCNHCFIMLNKKHYLYCPNCGAKMKGAEE